MPSSPSLSKDREKVHKNPIREWHDRHEGRYQASQPFNSKPKHQTMCKYSGKGCYCKETTRLELNASQGSCLAAPSSSQTKERPKRPPLRRSVDLQVPRNSLQGDIGMYAHVP